MIYEKYIRPHGRQLLIKSVPQLCTKKNIAIVGLPRSGTSWLAKAVSLTEKTLYYFEPDQEYDKSQLYPYVDQLQKNVALEKHIKKTFKGQITSEYVVAEQSIKDVIGSVIATNLLVKWVRFPFCLDWIKTTFPDLLLVQIIRHPVPLFLSWASRNWDPSFALKNILKQQNLLEGPLKDYQQLLFSATTPWQKAGAFWGAATYMQYHSQADKSLFRTHEWYCQNPKQRIAGLIQQLGLVENAALGDFLADNRQAKPGPGYGSPRNSQSEINKWHGKIDKQEYADLIGVITQFDFPFFDYFEPLEQTLKEN